MLVFLFLYKITVFSSKGKFINSATSNFLFPIKLIYWDLTKSLNNESKYSLNQYSLFLPSVPLDLSGYRTICMALNVTSASDSLITRLPSSALLYP